MTSRSLTQDLLHVGQDVSLLLLLMCVDKKALELTCFQQSLVRTTFKSLFLDSRKWIDDPSPRVFVK